MLTKLDGTAKGGVVLAVARELGVPVRWVGVGEAAEDLLPFVPDSLRQRAVGGAGMTGKWIALMRRALELAERGRYGTSPNPMVGRPSCCRAAARLSGRGRTCAAADRTPRSSRSRRPGRGRRAAPSWSRSSRACTRGGRRPASDALLAAGIARVVIGTRDPNPLVNGSGVEALRTAGVEVVEGVEEEACRKLNRRFFHWVATGSPYVTLKMAMTLDGKLAARGGRSRWITSEASRREGYALREEYDALLVGVNTVLADDPRLLRHLGLNPDSQLLRVVLDSHLRTPSDAALLQRDPQDVVIFCSEGVPADRRKELEDEGRRGGRGGGRRPRPV